MGDDSSDQYWYDELLKAPDAVLLFTEWKLTTSAELRLLDPDDFSTLATAAKFPKIPAKKFVNHFAAKGDTCLLAQLPSAHCSCTHRLPSILPS
jgi:hypothetical protein